MIKNPLFYTNKLVNSFLSLELALLLVILLLISNEPNAFSIGFISHHAPAKLPSRWQSKSWHSNHYVQQITHQRSCKKKFGTNKTPRTLSSNKVITNTNKEKDYSTIENLIADLQCKKLMPGIVYKKGNNNIRLNILDIDTVQAPVVIKPIIASQGTTRLQTVKDHTTSSHAIAAINANYFKNTGVPLGTLIIDGDWVSGPLYDRVALGINKSGFVRIDRVGLGGLLYTSNSQAPKIWVNNINVPRRTGCRTVAYSRKWGNSVHLQYDGCLVAIDAQGKVLDTDKRNITIPYGGIVLTDSKDSILSVLQRGDQTYLRWQISPQSWQDINQAVSGGPMLIKDNNYCINLKAESFHSNWNSNSIKARTACGVTANNHLLLVTAEGPHTLYDLAHILHALGAVDAMNLDGGGSTTMVIHDSTVNMESKSNERRVAVALGVFVMNEKEKTALAPSCNYLPKKETVSMIGERLEPLTLKCVEEENGLVQEIINKTLNLEPTITAEKLLENHPLPN